MTKAGRTILTNLVAARWQMGFSLGWHIVLFQRRAEVPEPSAAPGL